MLPVTDWGPEEQPVPLAEREGESVTSREKRGRGSGELCVCVGIARGCMDYWDRGWD